MANPGELVAQLRKRPRAVAMTTEGERMSAKEDRQVGGGRTLQEEVWRMRSLLGSLKSSDG